MKLAKMVLAAAAVAGMFAVCNPTARADDWNQLTEMTFTHPVQIPGHKVLAPGTYWFKVQDRDLVPSPQAVVIYNHDQTKVEDVLLTVPAEMTTPAAATEVTLAEQGQNRPDALITWYYPGKRVGHQFIYSAHEQQRLDQSGSARVIAPPAQIAG